MKIEPCQGRGCNNIATEMHHPFSNSVVNRRIYGKKLLDEFAIPYCNDCNGSHRNVITWNEAQFRKEVERWKPDYKLPPGGKTFQRKNFS